MFKFIIYFKIQEKKRVPSIKINNLAPAGSDLFNDSESYLNELNDSERAIINGGITPTAAAAGAFIVGFVAGYLISQSE